MVVHAFEDGHHPRTLEHLVQAKVRHPARRTQDTAVEMETDHLRHHLRAHPVERCRRSGQVAGQFGLPPLGAQECVRGEPRCQHALDHQDPFGDHQTLSAGQVGPAVHAVEITEVIESPVAGIGDVDDGAHGVKVTAMSSPVSPVPPVPPVQAPPLPAALVAPQPVIGAGALLWALAALAAFTVDGLHSWRPVTIAGLGVGVLGASIYLWQLAAARRGSRGAQTGLEP